MNLIEAEVLARWQSSDARYEWLHGVVITLGKVGFGVILGLLLARGMVG